MDGDGIINLIADDHTISMFSSLDSPTIDDEDEYEK